MNVHVLNANHDVQALAQNNMWPHKKGKAAEKESVSLLFCLLFREMSFLLHKHINVYFFCVRRIRCRRPGWFPADEERQAKQSKDEVGNQ